MNNCSLVPRHVENGSEIVIKNKTVSENTMTRYLQPLVVPISCSPEDGNKTNFGNTVVLIHIGDEQIPN